MGRVLTIWEPCVFRDTPSVPLANVANGDICFFTERGWSQQYCHGNDIVGVTLFLCDALFWCQVWRTMLQNFGDILDLVLHFFLRVTIYDVITFLICVIQKREKIERKKIFQKRKAPFLFTLKSLSNKLQLLLFFGFFLLHRHLNNNVIREKINFVVT